MTSQAIAVRHAQQFLSENYKSHELDVLRRFICANATDDEIVFFTLYCKSKSFDPFGKQIFLIKSGDRVIIHTGIDALRARAARSGEYAGQDQPIFDDIKAPTACTVVVYRFVKSQRIAFAADAWMDECKVSSKPGSPWVSRPRTMLAKCAEAAALRKAFPDECEGLYVKEEVEEQDLEAAATTPKQASVADVTARLLNPAAAPKQPTQVERIVAAFAAIGRSQEELEGYVSKPLTELEEIDIDALRSWYEELTEGAPNGP